MWFHVEPVEAQVSRRRWRRFHLALGACVCVLIPAQSWRDGSGRLAYGMFAQLQWYRLEIFAYDEDGRVSGVSPTDLANASGVSAAPFFSGADQFRRAAIARTPREHVADVARLACLVSGAEHVEAALLERDTMEGPTRRIAARVRCPR